MVEIHKDRSPNVLVVDDDQMLNQLLCEFLHGDQLQTHAAYSLADAKRFLRADLVIDLILLDYQLGDGTGLEFMQLLLAQEEYSSVPVIMISVNEDPVFLQDCFAAGIADYIIKPINFSLLALKVRALIKSVAMQHLIRVQNDALARFKLEAEREESIAKFIYQYLLGQNSQPIAGVNSWLQSSSSFSGDIALARRSPSGDLYFMLADATGHGLSAAIMIMPAVAIFNSMVAKGFHVQPIVTELNKKLTQDTPGDRFVAAIIIQVQLATNELQIWNGGMPTAYWINKGAIEHSFRSRHMALGILDDDMFDSSVEVFHFFNQGFLFVCSDGFLEAENSLGESYSSARLSAVVASQPPDLLAALTKSLAEHTGVNHYRDDVSLCTLTPAQMSSLRDPTIDLGIKQSAIDIGCFSWAVELSGQQIAHCELPPLANTFLQSMGVGQHACQIIFLIVSEMVSNAIDHGVLRLNSALKQEDNGFERYMRERERRLKLLNSTDLLRLELEWQQHATGPALHVRVSDSGSGYDPAAMVGASDDHYYGRGLHLIRQLSHSMCVEPPGNAIRVVINAF